MRPALTLLHRWFGLFIAGFLVVSGLTGAVISWDHELDTWLNPELYRLGSQGTPRDPLALAALIEARDHRARVTLVPLHPQTDKAQPFIVRPRVDPATGQLFKLDYNQVFIDPVSGEEQGRRAWGSVSVSRQNLMPINAASGNAGRRPGASSTAVAATASTSICTARAGCGCGCSSG
jgi:uncharacterized iron-regulated membrane protein